MATTEEQTRPVEGELQTIVTQKLPAIEFNVTDAALNDLAERLADPDASTDDGYERCKEGVKECTSLRTNLEARRKQLKQPALDFGRQVDAAAKRLESRIKKIEGPVAAEKETVDKKRREEARKALEEKQARDAAIEERIQSLKGSAAEQQIGDSSTDYADRINGLKSLDINEDLFGERIEEAETIRDASIYKLQQWHDAAVAREKQEKEMAEERARLAAQQAEIDKRAAEQKAEQDRIDEQKRKAEREKAEAEERERARKAAEQKAIDDRKAEVQRRIDDIAAHIDRARDFGLVALEGMIASLESSHLAPADFDDKINQANKVKTETLSTLRAMHDEMAKAEQAKQAEIEARTPEKAKLEAIVQAAKDIVVPKFVDGSVNKIAYRLADDLIAATQRAEKALAKL